MVYKMKMGSAGNITKSSIFHLGDRHFGFLESSNIQFPCVIIFACWGGMGRTIIQQTLKIAQDLPGTVPAPSLPRKTKIINDES
jgi:hypothetical protein